MEKKLLMEWDEMARKELAQLNTQDEVELQLLESIQDVYIEAPDLCLALGEIVFTDIYPGRLFHYDSASWKFSRQVDDVILKEEDSPFWLQVVLPGGEFLSQDKTQLLLPQDDDLYAQLLKVLKVETVLQPALASEPLAAQPFFIQSLNQDVLQWRRNIRSRLDQDLLQAQIFVDGDPARTRGQTGAQVVETALLAQLRQLYPRFGYIQEHIRSESQLQGLIKTRNVQVNLLLLEPENQRALDEVENHLSTQAAAGIPVYMEDLYQIFTQSPYGWLKLDVESLLIQLLKDQRIQLIFQEQLVDIDHPELASLLSQKSDAQIQVLQVQKAQRLDPDQVQSLLQLVFEGKPAPAFEPSRRLAIIENLENRWQQVNEEIQAHLADSLWDSSSMKAYRHSLNTILMQKASTEGMLWQLSLIQEDFQKQARDFQQLAEFIQQDGALYTSIWQWRSSLGENEACLKQDETMARLLERMDDIFQDPFQYRHFDELLDLYNEAYALEQKQCQDRQLRLIALLDEWIARFEEFEKEIGSFSVKPAQTLEFLRAKKEYAGKTWQLLALDQDLKQMDLYCRNTLPVLEQILKNKNRRQNPDNPVTSQPAASQKTEPLFPATRLENEAQVKAYLKKAEARLMAAIQAHGAAEIK